MTAPLTPKQKVSRGTEKLRDELLDLSREALSAGEPEISDALRRAAREFQTEAFDTYLARAAE